MSRRYLWSFVALVLIGGITISPSRSTQGGNAKPLPRKGWTVGFHAYRMSGFNDIPVKVIGVGSAGERGLQVAHVSGSKASQIITAVRIKWYVSEMGKTSILAKGETRWLDLPGLTGAQPKFDVAVPDADLDKIMRPVMEHGGLHGDYDVQVVVAEVRYLGGSAWKLPEINTLATVPIKKNHHAAMDLCPNQTCRLNVELAVYQCGSGQQELCENYGQDCNSWICGTWID
jgi:hypothetical protein